MKPSNKVSAWKPRENASEFSALDGLNDAQSQAVQTTEGYVRVVAGAGSGKTKALTRRYLYLVKNLNVMPANILCVTFTNKAANEMKKRIRQTQGDLDLGQICTFHRFGLQVIREHCAFFHLPSNFRIVDEEDVGTIIKECFENLGVDPKRYTLKEAKDDIARKKKDDLSYVEWLGAPNFELIDKKAEKARNVDDRVFFEFLRAQRKNFCLDFDDLINFALYGLQNDSAIREKWQTRLQYVMIDEFQDVSSRQYLLAKIISDYHKNLFIVGDPDQTIYTWRGANVDYILHFDREFPNVKTIEMNTNYRSTSSILNASNSLIKKNKARIDRDLVPFRKGRGKSVYFHAKTQEEESLWIANQIQALKKQGADFSEIAILYRAHFLSRSLEETLVNAEIPYVLYSGVAFYQRKEIKDVLSYLHLIVNPNDNIAFSRVVNVPNRGIGKKRIEFLKEYSASNDVSFFDALIANAERPYFNNERARGFVALVEELRAKYKTLRLSDLVAEVLDKSKYEETLRRSGEDERLENIAELIQSVFDYEHSAGEEVILENYLEHIDLFTSVDREEKPDSVKLMTIHTAKGLEFSHVFVCGLNEGVFPSSRTKSSRQMEEERRLAFVAFTRAKDNLFLTDSEGYNYDGSFRYPSRFIFNTEKVNLDYVVELPRDLASDAEKFVEFSEKMLTDVDEANLQTGDRIRHQKLGEGVISGVDVREGCYIVKFDALETPRNISLQAPLEKLSKK